jgi:hypothetical protein
MKKFDINKIHKYSITLIFCSARNQGMQDLVFQAFSLFVLINF